MRAFRFSILTLLGVTAYVAIGATAFHYNTVAWAENLRGIVVLFLLILTLASFLGSERSRPYWAGFTLFGWTYFVLSDLVDRLTGQSVQLPTASLIDWIWLYYSWSALAANREFDYETFLVIGHTLFTLPFACLGGIIAQVMYTRSSRNDGEAESVKPL